MNPRRLGVLAVVALAAIAAALYVNSVRNRQPAAEGQRLLPAFAAELNAVTSLSLLKGSAVPTVTLHRTNEQWTVAERADYPADVGKLRTLLTALGDARVIEQKTANPANFAAIGVEDPTQTGAQGTEVKLDVKDGARAVIVGKPSGEGSFARRVGENQSFLVQPSISAETEPHAWIESRLLDIPAASIQRIELKPDGGPGYTLHRLEARDAKDAKDGKGAKEATDAKDAEFTLEGVPAGRKPLDSRALAPSQSMFSSLSAEDVAAEGGIDFGKAARATITLTDGAVISLTGTALGDKHWLTVKSTKDATLSARAAGRAFEVAGYRYDGIFRPLEQLLVPKEAPTKGKSKTP